MNDIRIGFLRGLGYITAFLFISLIFAIVIFIAITIRKSITDNETKQYLNQNINIQYIQ